MLLNLEREPLDVLDIGAGKVQMGIKLTQMRHRVHINDISKNILGLVQGYPASASVEEHIKWHHDTFQNIEHAKYERILRHAVLEWLNQPL